MKPKVLILSGWGPYKDKVEIDFTGLEKRGLFLITGATGAGKTTIFDAITYALYGYMSGEMREKNSVRSDFADADTVTFAELSMQHGSMEYRIVRNPEYLRPKKRNSNKSAYTKEKETAVLYMPDGSIVQGVSEVNRKMQEILVLDYRQFKQISMIAQGEFSRFLTASPGEKTRIFREIFSTGVYDRFAGILRSRSGELYKKVMECRHRMDEDIHMLQTEELQPNEELSQLLAGESLHYEKIADCLEIFFKDCQAKMEENQRKYEIYEKEVIDLTEEKNNSQRTNENLCKLKAALDKQIMLLKQRPEIEEYEKELAKSRIAAGLNGVYIRWQSEKDMLRKLADRQQENIEEIRLLLEKQENLKGFHTNWESLRAGYLSRNNFDEKKKSLTNIESQIEKRTQELCKLQGSYVNQEKEAEKKKTDYELADRAYKRAAVGIAARLVKDGEPCPVCGSMVHPKVASVSAEVPDEEKLQRLREACDKSQELLMELHGKTAACAGELQNMKAQKDSFAAQAEEYRRELEKIPDETVRIMERMPEKEAEEAAAQYQKLQTRIDEHRKLSAKYEEERNAQMKLEKEAGELLEIQCSEAGFADISLLLESMRDSKRTEELEKIISEYYRELQALNNLISHLEGEIKNKEETDIEGLDRLLAAKKERKQETQELQAKWAHCMKETKKICSALKTKIKITRKLNKEYGIVKDLDNLTSGNNSKRLVFEQYVLAGYFEEILRAANIRLLGMTNGRFELSRVEEVLDGRIKDNLDMQVLDYYTGKYRPVKTLSGGESFKASLALALGMSDVIQGYSGGIRVDTLFIDEGFGSLDSESLEQACQTLMSLAEKDRLIGIISHVPELAEKIGSQIVVTKTNLGSKIKVMV